MWRLEIFLFVLLSGAADLYAQQLSDMECILNFIGVSAVEELSEDEVERFLDYLERPLCLNVASLKHLEESGLMTRYQAVSLSDYRSRHGDVLSYAELGAVDGFGEEFVRKLMPFVSLESGRMPGRIHDVKKFRHDAAVRTGIKSGMKIPEYGIRYRMEAYDRICCGLAVSRSTSAESLRPDALSGYLAWHFRKIPGKLVAGDFNARFGQGLALWNGMSMGSLSSPSSFLKRTSGLSLTSSFTGNYAFRGLGTDMFFGSVRLTALLVSDKKNVAASCLPAVNVSWFGRYGSLALTHYAEFRETDGGMRIPDMKTSFDAAFCLSGVDCFAEVAFDWVSKSGALLGGSVFRTGERLRLGIMLRYYPDRYSPDRSAAARSTTKCSNEYALSLAGDFNGGRWVQMNGKQGFGASVRRFSGNFCLDAAYFPVPKSDLSSSCVQVKMQTEWKIMISDSFRTDIRITERLRTWGNISRTDMRADLRWFARNWNADLRLNAVRSAGWGILCYAEGGYVPESLSLYVRLGIFRVDDWDDRIYVYERNAPGTFSVPAYYGRGVWAAFTAGWKYVRWGKIFVRAAFVSYPFMVQKKPGKAELKLQFMFDI